MIAGVTPKGPVKALRKAIPPIQLEIPPEIQGQIRREISGKTASDIQTLDSLALPDLKQIAELIGHWESIDQAFREALDGGQLPVKALGNLGLRLCKAVRNPEAVSVLSAAVALEPGEIPLLNNLAVALERAGQTASAIHVVQRSLSLDRFQTDSWVFLGTLRRKQNQPNDARQAYETALQLNPGSQLIWQELGLLLKDQRNYPQAIEALLNSIRHGSVTAPLLSVLGQLFFTTGQFEKSRDAYRVAAELDPEMLVCGQMHRQMGFVCHAMHRENLDDAIQQHGGSETELHDLLHITFALLNGYGHAMAAKSVAEKRLALFPESAAASYLAHAIRGDRSLARTPNEFLIETFDKAAERFDEHLVNTLGYDIPRKLVDAARFFIPPHRKLAVLDAGCGTGLCGPLLRGLAASLTGVDLSPGMIAQAERRGVYDHLACAELSAFLSEHLARFDLITAADVVIYFGDLESLAERLAGSLTPSGLLAFSTEITAAGWQLQSSGRFGHCADYVRSVFGRHFTELHHEQTTVRYEANRAVPGEIYVFRLCPAFA